MFSGFWPKPLDGSFWPACPVSTLECSDASPWSTQTVSCPSFVVSTQRALNHCIRRRQVMGCRESEVVVGQHDAFPGAGPANALMVYMCPGLLTAGQQPGSRRTDPWQVTSMHAPQPYFWGVPDSDTGLLKLSAATRQ